MVELDSEDRYKCDSCKQAPRYVYVVKLIRETKFFCKHCMNEFFSLKTPSDEAYVTARIDNWHVIR